MEKIGNLESGRLREGKGQTDLEAEEKSIKYKREKKISLLPYQIVDFILISTSASALTPKQLVLSCTSTAYAYFKVLFRTSYQLYLDPHTSST